MFSPPRRAFFTNNIAKRSEPSTPEVIDKLVNFFFTSSSLSESVIYIMESFEIEVAREAPTNK